VNNRLAIQLEKISGGGIVKMGAKESPQTLKALKLRSPKETKLNILAQNSLKRQLITMGVQSFESKIEEFLPAKKEFVRTREPTLAQPNSSQMLQSNHETTKETGVSRKNVRPLPSTFTQRTVNRRIGIPEDKGVVGLGGAMEAARGASYQINPKKNMKKSDVQMHRFQPAKTGAEEHTRRKMDNRISHFNGSENVSQNNPFQTMISQTLSPEDSKKSAKAPNRELYSRWGNGDSLEGMHRLPPIPDFHLRGGTKPHTHFQVLQELGGLGNLKTKIRRSIEDIDWRPILLE
jgi:hypothetical protein